MAIRVTGLTRILVCSACITACHNNDLSLGEIRCFGERLRCKIPCTPHFEIEQRSVDATLNGRDLQARWLQPFCQADACKAIDWPDSLDFLLHENGEATAVSLWNSAQPRPLLHVTRFSPDGDVLWTYERTFDESAPPSWMAMAANAPDTTGVVIALHGIQSSGNRSTTSTMVFELDEGGLPLAPYTLHNSRRPLAMARWNTDLLIVSDAEASLYDTAGELKWRQSAIGQGPEAGEPPTFAYFRAAQILEYEGRPLIIRREPSNVQSLVQLDEDGNVAWYSYAPPFQKDAPLTCSASVDHIYAEQSAPRLRVDGDPPQIDFGHNPFFVDALAVLDSEQRLNVVTTGFWLTRFVAPLPVPEAGEFLFAPNATLFQRQQPQYGGSLMGLDIDDSDQIYVMALADQDNGPRRLVERFSSDLQRVESMFLPDELEELPTRFRGLRLGTDDTLYTMGYGPANSPRPVLLVRFSLPPSPF